MSEDFEKDFQLVNVYTEAEMTQFEEVGGTCSNKDNPNEACCTFRSLVIGLAFVLGMSYLHQWSNFRPAGTFISSVLTIVLVYPIGKIWSKIIPYSKPFTKKEHGFILIMSNVSWMYYSTFTYATLSTLKVLELDNLNFAYYFFFVLSIQFLGFGLAGTLRRFLVWPVEVIWPQNLPLIAILRTLHEYKDHAKKATYDEKKNEKRLKILLTNPLTYFILISIVTFVYEWLPMFIMPILRHFSWMCLIQPNNNPLAQLTAVRGLAIGGGGLTIDWNEITQYLGSPMILPGWALANVAFGFVLIIWIIVPIVYGSNVRNLRESAVGGVVSSNFTTMSLVTAFTSFACVSAVFIHTMLFYGSKIWNLLSSKANQNKSNDMHSRLMSLYAQVPDWWYLELFAPAFIIACVVCDHAGWLPWYWVLFSLFIGAIFVLPFGYVSSITGQILHNLSVYYICILIVQSLPLASSARNTYTFIALSYVFFVQTLALVQDMKLAHYLKIGPRQLFAAQCLASLTCCTFSIGIRYMYIKRNTISTTWSIFNNTKLGWNLLNDYVGFFYGKNSPNRKLLWAFVLGAALPISTWFLSRYPRLRVLRHIHWPLILITIGWMPAIVSSGALFTWLVIGLTIFFTLGKYSFHQRRIYLTSGALDLGVNLALIFINLIFYNQKTFFPLWWGNQDPSELDSCALALKVSR